MDKSNKVKARHQTPQKRRLISYVKSCMPDLDDKGIDGVISDMSRFVKVIQKIYTEPQYTVSYPPVKKGMVVHRVFNTDMNEFMKAVDKNDGPNALQNAFRNFHKIAIKNEDDKRRK